MMARLKTLDRPNRLPGVAHVLSSTDSNLGSHDRYALWWALFRQLMEGPRRERFLEIAARAHKKRGEDLSSWLYATAGREVDGRRDLERSLEWAGADWIQHAFRSSPAVAWRTGPPPVPPYRFAGSLTLLEGRTARARLLLDRGEQDLLARQRPDGSWHGRAAGRPVQQFEYGPDLDTAYALLFLKRATTVVEGTRAGSRVACPPGPNRVRGPLPARWWPRLPEAKNPPAGGDPPGTLPK